MMDSGELAIAKREILAALQGLTEDSQFGIVFFDNNTTWFPSDGKPAPATAENISAAATYLGQVPPGSGSCMQRGLLRALEFVQASSARRNVINHVGDGGGTCGGDEALYLERTLGEVAERNDGGAGINTFGVLMTGRLVQEAFLQRLAAANGGIYRRVEADEEGS
jgi:hypothetical protein